MVLVSGPLYGDTIEQLPPTPAEEQPEVLASGPVHEAFAEPVDLQVQDGLVAPLEPPPNIVENPPSEKPAGGQFVWVPGYWAWDSERNCYIWVSGCWRAAPQNMYWVPGYWTKVPEGWEWVSGFWMPVTRVQQIEYLPAPPTLDDVQPPDNPQFQDRIWVPPCWYWYHGGYVLRHGYWLVAQPSWVWVPSHYVWTPMGYVFVEGYWDYSLERRGVLFAPVYFPTPIYKRPGFSFSVGIAIDIGNVQFSLFTCPRYCHYYFGDYYDDIYISIGIYPSFECVWRHTWYDPIYEYDRCRFRKTDPHWEEHRRNEYDLRRANKDIRPPRTYHEMEARMAKLPESKRKDIQMARPINDVVAGKTTPLKFEQINNNARKKIDTRTTNVRKFREERSHWESPAVNQRTVQPPIEHKGSVTPSMERKSSVVTPPAERKASVSPPTEHKGPVTPSIERKSSVVTPPTERQGPVTPPNEHRDTVPTLIERNHTFNPPRKVNLTQAEKVTIPKPPIVGKQRGGIFVKGPPSRPADEQKAENRDTHRDTDARGDKSRRSRRN